MKVQILYTRTRLTIQGKLSDTHAAVFATAGQDAFAMVVDVPYFTWGKYLQQYDLQISAFPVPRCIVHFADAAAIKVRLLHVCQIGYF